MFKLLESKRITVTPDKARELLTINGHDAQRSLSRSRIEYIKHKMESGLFRHADIAVAHNGDKVSRLMNGQHTCTAAVELGQPFAADYELYECDTPDDFSLLFRQFDPKIASRSLANMERIESVALGLTWADSVVGLVVSAISVNTGRYRDMSSEDKIELLRDNLRAGEWVNEMLAEGKRKTAGHLMRKSIVAAMLRTWNKCQKDASAFWLRVRDGENITRSMSEYHLRDFLMQHYHPKGPHGMPAKMISSDHEFLYRCIVAWNSFRSGRTPSFAKYHIDKQVPKAL